MGCPWSPAVPFDMDKDTEQQQLAVDGTEDLPGASIESVPMEGTSHHRGWEGQTVDGKFALLEWLGGTADRDVFLTLRQGGHKAAIKLIQAEGTDADDYLAQWEIAKSLTHRHLMPVVDYGRCTINGTNLVYLVTEHAERVLSEFIQHRPLAADETKDIVHAVVEGLAYLHANGIIHGHLKPSNILIVHEELKISADEFLVAGDIRRPLAERTTYDAPEATGETVTSAVDVWSLGVTLVEALTQRLPVWDGSTMHQPVVPDTLPTPFLVLARRCLPVDPTWRYTLDDVRTHLDNVRTHVAHSAAPAASAAIPTPPEPPVAHVLFPKATESAAVVAPEPRATVTQNQAPPLPPEPSSAIPERRSGTLDRRATQPRTTANDRRAPAPAPRAAAPEARAIPEPESIPEPEAFAPTPVERAPSRPASRWASDEEPITAGTGPGLFEDIEEANLTRNSLLPLVFGIVLVLVIAGYALVRSGIVTIQWPYGSSAAPVARQSAPVQQPSRAPEASTPASAANPDTASSSTGTGTGTEKGNTGKTGDAAAPNDAAAQAGPAAAAPSTTPPPSRPMTGVSNPPEPTQPATRKNQAPARAAEEAQPPASAAPARPSNAAGEVANRVMPSPSPAAASSMHEPVDVVLRLTVDRNGKVADASYVSPGPGNYFARIAQRAAEGWAFNPPLRGGRAETSVWRLRFHFWHRSVDVEATEEGR